MGVNMKKLSFIIGLLCITSIFWGCKKDTVQNPAPTGQVTEAPSQAVTQIPEDTEKQEEITGIMEYLPEVIDSAEFIYEGEGNEYASFHAYVDFADKEKGLYQVRTNNGGTEKVDVYQIKDGVVSIVATRQEVYYRDNLLEEEIAKENQEIVLMEPFVEGTEWKLPDGRKRYISAVDAKVKTLSGEFRAIEVTTEDSGSITKEYYAKGMGLVQRNYESEGFDITSSLAEIKKEVPMTQDITLYYIDMDESIKGQAKQLQFNTNDSTALKMQELLQQEGSEGARALISKNTKINTLYLSEDNIVHVDFSKEFVYEMNAGAGYESLILKAVANTLGNYYGADEVLLTLEQKPYESGHDVFEEGQTLLVEKK